MEYMSDEKVKILGSIKEDGLLLLIKEDAENFISGQVESEGVIINKSSNLFQVLIAVFISILTYLLSTYRDAGNVVMYNAAVMLSIFIAISIVLLLFVINPKKIRLRGSIPSNILDPDIFTGSEYDKIKFLKNRIVCLNRDIELNSDKQKIRVACYRASIAILIMGLIAVSFTFVFL